jgi:hypothetical protein
MKPAALSSAMWRGYQFFSFGYLNIPHWRVKIGWRSAGQRIFVQKGERGEATQYVLTGVAVLRGF